ncbi:hypothetical protein K493DRAFT_334518 [Basidiobolus meristosporus CBS 931.73]|uniref:RRM domain-containing protein n=1 Tax=Basidiobolus meristosporus CBS 931.73 TaxID=1314790 RepID=A0A1Y1YXE4_9FUNG|nr:hypothetical protein K493DRAFT_334518 [Basidiobolus meristosporus CBS 931.73]|eukprot:ORY02701.1 hypothetical protein K493DRAFT_334518 [Basidiobolus meristosporus CBS 931.73]
MYNPYPTLDSSLLVSPQQYQSGYDHHCQVGDRLSSTLPQSQPGRTIYVGNIPPDIPVEEVLSHVRGGPLESVKLLPEKSCIFVSFLDGNSANSFYYEASTKKITVRGHDLKFGWGKPSPVPNNILVAVQSGATRNVYLGSLGGSITEEYIREELSVYGPIDSIRIIKDKNIGFVHFLSIANAIRCVAALQSDSKWAGKRVNYGKDRCSQPIKFPRSNGVSTRNMTHPGYSGSLSGIPYTPYSNPPLHDYDGHAQPPSFIGAVYNRTIYLGNIHPETTCEDICNVIRGGILHQIRFLAEKHIAFVSFIDSVAAIYFYNLASFVGVMVKNRRLKVGWGKSTPLPPAVAVAVQSGATRNVYIGNIDDSVTEGRLKQDFSVFGEIELVNTLKDKNCAFVNFTNILSAVKAIDGIRSNSHYANFRINYGKDRCGNPARAFRNVKEWENTTGLSSFNHGEGFLECGSLYDQMLQGHTRGIYQSH